MKALSMFLIPLATVLLLAHAQSSYHVTHTYTLGGDGNWDRELCSAKSAGSTERTARRWQAFQGIASPPQATIRP